MKKLVENGKYNLSSIMKMAHAYLKAGFRTMASALRKAWDKAHDAMTAHKSDSWNHSNANFNLSDWTKRS